MVKEDIYSETALEGSRWAEESYGLAYPSCWTTFSLTGREITCGDLHSARCRWGLMNVVMIMMIIIQIPSYLYTPGRPVLPFVIWLNLRGDPPSSVFCVMSSHAWHSVSLLHVVTRVSTCSAVRYTEKRDCQEGPSWHGGQGWGCGWHKMHLKTRNTKSEDQVRESAFICLHSTSFRKEFKEN